MLNYIWAFMIIIGIIYGSLTGHMAELSNAALDSAKEAVTLCITMLGVMALWVGLMQIAQKAGIIASMTKSSARFFCFCFRACAMKILLSNTFPPMWSPTF